TPLEAEYESLQRYARWLGMAPRAAQTPHEFAASLASRIPTAAVQVVRIADLYVRSLFARDGLSDAEMQEAKGLWSPLRINFVTYFINSMLAKLFRPPKREQPEPYVLGRRRP
ncbi:MAG: DUF4129 domain-containing protein, partial [Chloroflexi bacterium]|nr:DUF4129 domain-containing protein [Chloroflexota bacterium]